MPVFHDKEEEVRMEDDRGREQHLTALQVVWNLYLQSRTSTKEVQMEVQIQNLFEPVRTCSNLIEPVSNDRADRSAGRAKQRYCAWMGICQQNGWKCHEGGGYCYNYCNGRR